MYNSFDCIDLFYVQQSSKFHFDSAFTRRKGWVVFFLAQACMVVAVGMHSVFFALVGGLKQWFWKNNTVNVGWIAKSVTEKNNRRGDCAEAGKKTMQTQRYEGWGFLPAGDLPGGAARNYLSGETWPLSVLFSSVLISFYFSNKIDFYI